MTKLTFAASVALSTLVAASAEAHFVLQSPANWMSQDGSGLPIKMAPCGNEGGGTPTNAVTTFKPGDTVSIAINEVVFHPGHYRVALAANQAGLPADPTVTAKPLDQCGSVAIDPMPALPVLKDGALDHTSPFSGAQTFTVKLPDNYTCNGCVLQVIEFMSSHPAPCFYHHCAVINIQNGGASDGGAPPTTDDGGSVSLDAATAMSDLGAGDPHPADLTATPPSPPPPGGKSHGCGLVPSNAQVPWALVLAAVALVALRRRYVRGSR